MNYKQHFSLGLSLQLIFIGIMYYFLEWFKSNLIQILILIFVTPLLCDLDHRHGKLREGVTFLGLMIGLLGIVMQSNIIMTYGIVLSSIAYLIFYTTKHRGFTHSITFCLLIGLGVWFLTKSYELSSLSIVGCYSHLIGDKIFIKFK